MGTPTVFAAAIVWASTAAAEPNPCACLDHPDRGVAATYSLAFGFGAGHFYAKRPGPGVAFLAVDVLGASLLASGLSVDRNDSLAEMKRKATIGKYGYTVLAANRAVQVVTAPGAVRNTIERADRQSPTSGTTPKPPAPQDIAQSTTAQLYGVLGWEVNELSDRWQLDVATVRAHLGEGVLPSNLVRAARAGAASTDPDARLSQVIAVGLKLLEPKEQPAPPVEE